MNNEINFINDFLIEVKGSVYFENKENAINLEEFLENDILDFFLIFRDLTIIIKGDSLAATVNLEESSLPKDINMGNDGFIKLLSLEKYLRLEDYIGIKVCGLGSIMFEGIKTGIFIVFENRKELIFVNLGDEIKLFKFLPESLVNEGYTKI